MQDPWEAFDALVARLDYPMFIVTVAHGGERAGCLVGFASQCSIDPPRFLACLSKKNRTFRLALEAGALAVHVVPQSAADVAELFGGETQDEVDKLSRTEWRPGPGGVPLLDACPGRFVGRVLDRHDVGDHVAFLLQPVTAEVGDDGPLLGFEQVRSIEPGHEA